MGEHLVDRLQTSLQSVQGADAPGECSHSQTFDPFITVTDIQEDADRGVAGEEDWLIQAVECRICLEEDSVQNLEIPCACSGSLKYAHRKCVQRWCNEKGDVTCEICHQVNESSIHLSLRRRL